MVWKYDDDNDDDDNDGEMNERMQKGSEIEGDGGEHIVKYIMC